MLIEGIGIRNFTQKWNHFGHKHMNALRPLFFPSLIAHLTAKIGLILVIGFSQDLTMFRILPLAFDNISAFYFTPFNIKIFCWCCNSHFSNSQGLFYMPSPGPSIVRYEYMQSSQGRYLCSCISSANAMHNATPAIALRSCHTLPSRGLEPCFGYSLFFENFPRSLPYTPNTVRGWTPAKQSPWLAVVRV